MIKQWPDNVQARISLSYILEQLNRPADADVESEKVLRLDPNNAAALNIVGYNLVERGENLNKALEMLQRAVNADPSSPFYLHNLGWAYFKLGRLDEAESYINRSLQRPGAPTWAYEHLGDVYDKQGKRDLAIGQWQKALSSTTDPKVSDRIKAKLSATPPKEK